MAHLVVNHGIFGYCTFIEYYSIWTAYFLIIISYWLLLEDNRFLVRSFYGLNTHIYYQSRPRFC